MNREREDHDRGWREREDLFARYLSGDASATRALFLALQKLLTGYFRARLGDLPAAEDLVQATLLKVHFSRDRFDSSRSLKTWVFTIASRTLIDHWRGGEPPSELLDDPEGGAFELPAPGISPEEKTFLHGDLNKALETLKPIDRSIVYLYGVEGLSMEEIAAVHSISEGAAKVRAHRAYRELKKILGVALLFFFWRTL